MNLSYDYDAASGQSGVNSTAGNSHQLISLTGTINGTAETASYTYDLQKRVVTSNQTSNGSTAQRKFAYDRWGNRSPVWPSTSGGTPIQTIALSQSGGAPTNQIASVTNTGVTVNYTYDAAGNVTNDGVHSYTYDAANRLVSVDGGTTAQYRYDHQNQRITKIVGSSWTHYIWEGGQVIGEHDATTAYTTTPPYQEKSARLDYIYARGKMIHTRERTSSTGPWTTRYYVSDVWSTRLVLDTSGNVLGRQGHLAFGEEFAESGTQEKHHFTSYESESQTATDYAVNRQYSQSVGRFGSADPYQASSYLVNPQSWNRYSYVENDPIHNVDPLGLLLGYPGPGSDPCCVSCTGGYESEPAPEPSKCSIKIRTEGRKHSTIDTRSDINSVNFDELGEYEHPIADGWWFFIFEVQISLGSSGREGWHFNQSVVRTTSLIVNVGGSLIPFQPRDHVDPSDRNLAENPRYTQLVGSLYYWIDEPGRLKVQQFEGDITKWPIVSGVITWNLVITADNSNDPRRSCSKRFQLKLSIGSKVKWKSTIF